PVGGIVEVAHQHAAGVQTAYLTASRIVARRDRATQRIEPHRLPSGGIELEGRGIPTRVDKRRTLADSIVNLGYAIAQRVLRGDPPPQRVEHACCQVCVRILYADRQAARVESAGG